MTECPPPVFVLLQDGLILAMYRDRRAAEAAITRKFPDAQLLEYEPRYNI